MMNLSVHWSWVNMFWNSLNSFFTFPQKSAACLRVFSGMLKQFVMYTTNATWLGVDEVDHMTSFDARLIDSEWLQEMSKAVQTWAWCHSAGM